jgi:hypothetical protein
MVATRAGVIGGLWRRARGARRSCLAPYGSPSGVPWQWASRRALAPCSARSYERDIAWDVIARRRTHDASYPASNLSYLTYSVRSRWNPREQPANGQPSSSMLRCLSWTLGSSSSCGGACSSWCRSLSRLDRTTSWSHRSPALRSAPGRGRPRKPPTQPSQRKVSSNACASPFHGGWIWPYHVPYCRFLSET